MLLRCGICKIQQYSTTAKENILYIRARTAFFNDANSRDILLHVFGNQANSMHGMLILKQASKNVLYVLCGIKDLTLVTTNLLTKFKWAKQLFILYMNYLSFHIISIIFGLYICKIKIQNLDNLLMCTNVQLFTSIRFIVLNKSQLRIKHDGRKNDVPVEKTGSATCRS